MFSQYWVLELLVSDILIPYIAFFFYSNPTNLKSDFKANSMSKLVRFIAWNFLHFSSILLPFFSTMTLYENTCTFKEYWYQSLKKKHSFLHNTTSLILFTMPPYHRFLSTLDFDRAFCQVLLIKLWFLFVPFTF